MYQFQERRHLLIKMTDQFNQSITPNVPAITVVRSIYCINTITWQTIAIGSEVFQQITVSTTTVDITTVLQDVTTSTQNVLN